MTEGHRFLKGALKTRPIRWCPLSSLCQNSTPVSLSDLQARVPGGAGPSLTHQAKQPRLARGVTEQEGEHGTPKASGTAPGMGIAWEQSVMLSTQVLADLC